MRELDIHCFGKKLSRLLKNTIKHHQPIRVKTKFGKVVVMSKESYDGLLATLSIDSDVGLKDKIIEGLNTPTKDCVPENQVQWQ